MSGSKAASASVSPESPWNAHLPRPWVPYVNLMGNGDPSAPQTNNLNNMSNNIASRLPPAAVYPQYNNNVNAATTPAVAGGSTLQEQNQDAVGYYHHHHHHHFHPTMIRSHGSISSQSLDGMMTGGNTMLSLKHSSSNTSLVGPMGGISLHYNGPAARGTAEQSANVASGYVPAFSMVNPAMTSTVWTGLGGRPFITLPPPPPPPPGSNAFAFSANGYLYAAPQPMCGHAPEQFVMPNPPLEMIAQRGDQGSPAPTTAPGASGMAVVQGTKESPEPKVQIKEERAMNASPTQALPFTSPFLPQFYVSTPPLMNVANEVRHASTNANGSTAPTSTPIPAVSSAERLRILTELQEANAALRDQLHEAYAVRASLLQKRDLLMLHQAGGAQALEQTLVPLAETDHRATQEGMMERRVRPRNDFMDQVKAEDRPASLHHIRDHAYQVYADKDPADSPQLHPDYHDDNDVMNGGNNGQSRYWTSEEHELFLEGVKKFGRRDARSVAQYVGSRSISQVRSHAQKYFQRIEREKSHQDLNQAAENQDPDSPHSKRQKKSFSENDLTVRENGSPEERLDDVKQTLGT
eukprot:CAMPEP_0184695944 /NCGR_PEP_ID=MMETSP0313-20130426/3397_1 /TAXON_ID=2792 /ORGANISM="Porphyridium aerugineum, Strain SAG 1380-2" /LENGTH=578 /DNA_ID=CAMNT_0027154473 /DNA_START=523 /DNA_END=2259 /DNA_ORIENTATION=-